MAEQLFWAVLEHLQTLQPGFAGNHTPKFAFRFKRLIHVVDSTTIQLMARSLDWAKHRRRKAAAKCHVRLNLQTFLPACAIVDTAAEHDSIRARELCASVQAGEIVIFDKAYVDFAHLADLPSAASSGSPAPRTTCNAGSSANFRTELSGNILRDDLIALTGPAAKDYPVELRRVMALVEVDGELREMVFLTNNLEWSAQTIADLYRCRWRIETFFKELKQTLQLADFLGHSANAVRWQVWTALLAYVLLRFCAWLGQLGPQLHPALCPAPLGPLATLGTAQSARSLWDSRWRRSLPGHAGTGLSGRLRLILWDSHPLPSARTINS